jgi:hypothetical protein
VKQQFGAIAFVELEGNERKNEKEKLIKTFLHDAMIQNNGFGKEKKRKLESVSR